MGISVTQLLVIAVIVVLLFGTKKLRTIGSDLGSAIKGFKKAVSEDDTSTANKQNDADFEQKNITAQQTTKPEEQKSNHKEQV